MEMAPWASAGRPSRTRTANRHGRRPMEATQAPAPETTDTPMEGVKALLFGHVMLEVIVSRDDLMVLSVTDMQTNAVLWTALDVPADLATLPCWHRLDEWE